MIVCILDSFYLSQLQLSFNSEILVIMYKQLNTIIVTISWSNFIKKRM